jgi:hypothetical protein
MNNKWLRHRRYRLEALAFIAWIDRGWPWPDIDMLNNIWCNDWIDEDRTLVELYQDAKKFIRSV